MRTLLYLVILSLILTTIYSCGPSGNSANNVHNNRNEPLYQEGFRMVAENCMTCHSTQANLENRIAPPLAAVKMHYLDKDQGKEEFLNDMVAFMKGPKIENSKMPQAIERFGLMPVLGYSEEQYLAVAEYIYHAEIEKPNWFDEHYEKEKAKILKHASGGKKDYLKKGLSMALATKAVLGSNLLRAIKTKGTTDALTFCSDRAIHLTDSMSQVLDVKIKRVSDNNRNPANLANAEELDYINTAKNEIEAEGSASPQIVDSGDAIIGYYPIVTNQMCLQCHGDPGTDIESNNLTRISELYPDDKAVGYGPNELRGIWVIEMGKQ